LWNGWDTQPRQWKYLLHIQDPTDRALFFASTYIHVGDGKNTPTWEAKWLNAAAPKELAPNLFKMARFKKRTVPAELHNNNWIKNLGEINNPVVLEEYILLYLALSTVVLSDQRDQIVWRWTSNGQYTASSAYSCQFAGAVTPFPSRDIWKAFAEPKCVFFAWLILHNKTQTVDNLLKKNWHGATECSLCLSQQETTAHLLTQCNFSEALWNLAANRFSLPSYAVMSSQGGPLEWVNFLPNQEDEKKENWYHVYFLVTVVEREK
jgi:hypothetical protein